MRQALKPLEGLRKSFTGVFNRYGTRINWNGYHEDTILLLDVKNISGKQVADHVWFSKTKGFSSLGELKTGDIIRFDARVKTYLKGYKGYREEAQYEHPLEVDYKLSNLTNIKLINKKPEKSLETYINK